MLIHVRRARPRGVHVQPKHPHSIQRLRVDSLKFNAPLPRPLAHNAPGENRCMEPCSLPGLVVAGKLREALLELIPERTTQALLEESDYG